MSASRTDNVPLPSRPVAAWNDFWFAAVDPVGLHRLRVLAGLVFLLWLLPFAGHVDTFFGLGGWFDQQAFREAASEAARFREEPPVPMWSLLYLCGTNATAVQAVYWASVVVLVLFTLGLWPRVTAALTYVVVASFTATPAVPYDADPLLILLAFTLMVGYLLLGQFARGVSLAERLLGPRDAFLLSRPAEGPRASAGANVAVRLLQVHFAVAVVASGLHKLQFGDWWSGLGYWSALHRPFETTVEEIKANRPMADTYLSLMSLAAYATLAWQIAFPAFAWRRGLWRVVLLGGAALAFVGCAFVLDLPLFGPLMVIGCLSYLTPAEWRRLDGLLAVMPGLRGLARVESPPPAKVAKATVVSGGHR